MKKSKLLLIGLFQAFGIVLYASLISGLFNLLENFFATPSQFWGPILVLTLLVFSAAITGLIVFGYPVYLALNKRIKEALIILAFTLFCGIGAIVITLIILYIIK